jgi:hypothetical protein
MYEARIKELMGAGDRGRGNIAVRQSRLAAESREQRYPLSASISRDRSNLLGGLRGIGPRGSHLVYMIYLDRGMHISQAGSAWRLRKNSAGLTVKFRVTDF